MGDAVRFVFRRNQNPNETIQNLSVDVYQTLAGYFSSVFPRYQPQQDRIVFGLASLLKQENMQRVLFPAQTMERAEAALKARIKKKEIDSAELGERGVVPFYALVKPAADNRGGDDLYDVYLLASLYVLPASAAVSKEATLKPEEYPRIKPHVNESFSCRFSAGGHGYFLAVGALNFGGAMAVKVDDSDGRVGHFHLAKQCTDGRGAVHSTENVLHLDGLKIYTPILIEENGGMVEKTLVLSASIVVMGGAPAWGLHQLSRIKKDFFSGSALTYGLGGLGEIWMVTSKSRR